MARKITKKKANPNTMWGGRYALGPAEIMEKINASIGFDRKLYAQDIAGSMAHCDMLVAQKIITASDGRAIKRGLQQVKAEIESGKFKFSTKLEDIHFNVEGRLTDLIGPAFDAPEYEPEKSIISDKFFLTSAAVFSLGWNTTALPGGLQKPEDLLDPALKGKIGIVNPSGIAAYVDFYRFFEKNFGPDYLQKLAELKPRIYPSALGVAQALTSGEIVATPVVQPLVREKESGAPVDWALPTPPWGTPWFTHTLSAAPHPNAAQVLANFMVTPAGQKALSLGYASALPGIEGSVARAQDIALPNPSVLTPESLTEYQADWEKRFIQ